MARVRQQAVVVQQQRIQTVIVREKQPNPCRAAIPSMHMAMAIVCLILNIFLPGIGTVVAGFTVFCCANKVMPTCERAGAFCINFWVGLVQLFLAPWIVGWFWAIMWGAIMISRSKEYHNQPATTTRVFQSNVSPRNVVITSQTQQQLQQQPYHPQGYAQQRPPQQAYQQQPPPQQIYPQQRPPQQAYQQQLPPQQIYPQQPPPQQAYQQQPPPQQIYPQQPPPQQGYPQQLPPQQSFPTAPPAYDSLPEKM